jgi:glycosyltransferase involved in cell wall biosynthesis
MSIPSQGGGVRVLRLFSRLNVGGPSIHVIVLTSGLVSRGYETRLLVGSEGVREGNLFDFAAQHGVECERVAGLGREIRPLADLGALWRVYRVMRGFRPHIVHTHTAKAGFIGRVAARLAGVPIVVHTFHGHVLRGYFGRAKTAFYRFLERGLARGSNVLVAVSDAVKNDLVELEVAPAAKIRVIRLGLPLEELAGSLPSGGLRREANIPSTATVVGIVGRLAPIKDLPCFLEAAALVHRSHPDVHFAIVGDGEQRADLEARTQVLGLAQHVHFFGWRRDMAAVYGDIDIAVNCSRNEGTPVSLIEALSAGRPVVATAVGGTPDVLRNGEFGTLVPPADSAALAQAIQGALHDPGLREKAEAGRRHVLAAHSTTRLLGDIDHLYRELLAAEAAKA